MIWRAGGPWLLVFAPCAALYIGPLAERAGRPFSLRHLAYGLSINVDAAKILIKLA